VPALSELQLRTLADRWILSRFEQLTRSATRLIEDFQLGEAGRQVNDFFWSDYCDWYVEIAKVQMQGDEHARRSTAAILRAVLDQTLRLLHPYMPFVTEEVWQHLYRTSVADHAQWPASALIIAQWPQFDASLVDEAAEQQFGLVQEVVTRIRDARNQMNVEPARRIPAILVVGDDLAVFEEQTPLIEFLARTQEPELKRDLDVKSEQAMGLLAGNIEIYLPLAGMIDIGKELARLDKEIALAEQEQKRLQAKLSNQNFVAKAKPEVVEKEREKLNAQEDRLAKLQTRRAELAN